MPSCPPLKYALAGLAACMACKVTTAAQWSFQPSIDWKEDYDSNRRLAASNEVPSDGTWLTADATLSRITESTEWDFVPHLQAQRFGGDSALDANNYSLNGAFQGHTELFTLTASGGYEHASTLIAEPSDTGIIDASTARDTGSGRLVLGHDFTERQHMDVQAAYADVTYPGGSTVGLVGYRYTSAATVYTFKLSALTALSATGYGDWLTAPVTGYVSRDSGATLGVTYSPSERVSFTASAGGSSSTVNSVVGHGAVFGLQASRNYELSQLSLSYNRSLQPSGLGFLVRRDQLLFSLNQNIAPKLFATATVQGVLNHDLTTGPYLDIPRYFTGDAGLQWRASDQWTINLTAGATFVREPATYQNINQTAKGWHAALDTRWALFPRSVSR